MTQNKTDTIWDEIIDAILKGKNNRIKEWETKLKLKIYQLSNKDISLSSCHTNIVLCPLFEIENNQLFPKGLSNIHSKLYKNSKFNFNTIFLIANRSDVPDPFNPHKDMTYYAKNLIRNPKFGWRGKALLMLELIFKHKEVINIVDIYSERLLDDILLAIMAVKEIAQFKGYYRWRARFYETFVKFYDNFENANKTHIDWNAPEKLEDPAFITDEQEKNITWENLYQTNDFYNYLNGTLKQRQNAHHVPLELFRAPIPFPLQELVNAKNEIGKELKKGGMNKKIKLLLIDNRSDNKFISKNGNSPKAQSLCDLLFSEDDGFGLGDIFEIQMLGNAVYKKKNGTPKFYQNDNELSNYSDFKGEYEEFKFKRFKEPESLKKPEKEYLKAFIEKQNKSGIENYADLAYHKIKDAHFVLLDFFLDDDDTYMAFNFIKDICDLKRAKKDYSTTWFFITSAVYDSVVKYSQSGLLSEYYESAVVCAGDDPTNKKRQIIFLYKLLTFIQSRLNCFKKYEDMIMGEFGLSEECSRYKGGCKKEDCLEGILSLTRKYLAEHGEISNVFSISEDSDKKNIAEILDNLIKQFIWLPEADWYMIQHQIDFINTKLSSLQDKRLKKCKFSCKYIIEELKYRSEVY